MKIMQAQNLIPCGGAISGDSLAGIPSGKDFWGIKKCDPLGKSSQ